MSTYKFIKSLGHKSIIEYVNSKEDSSINVGRLNKVLQHMFDNHWKEIKIDEDMLELISPSTQIRYIIKDETGIYFRTGGFYIKFYKKEDDPNLTDSYLLYATHVSGVNRTVQLGDLYKFYIKQKPIKKFNKIGGKVYYKYPEGITDYPVHLEDEKGNSIIIYYAQSESKRDRFINSAKYRKAKKYGWEFE